MIIRVNIVVIALIVSTAELLFIVLINSVIYHQFISSTIINAKNIVMIMTLFNALNMVMIIDHDFVQCDET